MSPVRTLIERWRVDPGVTYRTWLLWEERLESFRSIRRGIGEVVAESSVRLIDVLWLAKVVPAFEVEHSTSIYAGIVRMLVLALGGPGDPLRGLFLVAPDEREEEVRKQLRRPAFRRVADLGVRYLHYSELAENREAMARFGEGLRPIEAAARTLA